MSDNTAILYGYTREVMGYNIEGDELHLFVHPSTELDDSFKAYDADACEFIRVYGWLWAFEDVDQTVTLV